ncbi:hypothetical protein LDENG_00013500 [Lucifuga dentata]|nr:hypothetical protein LDENG_00013500 [Lucifuga dentata]
MNASLGRNGLIGLAVGATAGLGLIAFVIYKEITKRRRSQRMRQEVGSYIRLFEESVGPTLVPDRLDGQEAKAQQQALAAVEAVVQGLTPEQQLQLRNQLDQVLDCVVLLRSEVAELRGGLQDIALQIVQDVKKGVEDSQRIRRRRHIVHRERTESTGSSSIYFTASQGMASAYETSEGGYSTAYAESDYTDRDTDREEGDKELEQESEEDKSSATVVTLRQGDSQEEEVGEEEGVLELVEEEEQERRPQLVTEVSSGELALLLAQSDVLHSGDASLKAQGFCVLLDNRAEYGDNREFLWRLARAYCDMYESTEDKQEKKTYAQKGREEAEIALKKNGQNFECHKWFAVLSELTSRDDSMHAKLKSSQILKEHLDRAIALKDDDPLCFYLLGRWCFEVSTFSWLEGKAAAAIYECPPNSTLQDALHNFLKVFCINLQAEELKPKFSKKVRLYIAMCHKELGNISAARNWTELALKMPVTAKDDEETCKLEAQLCALIK